MKRWECLQMGARNRGAEPLLIVRAATKRRYRRCCPLLWRCYFHCNDVRCRSARCCHRDDQARKEASQEPAHSVPAYLAHHRTASRARRTIFNAYRVKSFILLGLSDSQTGRARRCAAHS